MSGPPTLLWIRKLHWKYLAEMTPPKETIEAEILLLQQLFVLSQTQSLILDEVSCDALQQIAEEKAEIVERLAAGSPVSTNSREKSAELTSLRQTALDLISRITSIDANNGFRLEQMK